MASTPTPLQDTAQPILAGDPQLDDNARANLWDAFNQSKSPDELLTAMKPLLVPEDTKRRLLVAKQQAGSIATPPPPSNPNPAAAAIGAMASIPQETLDMAEQHPNVLKVLVESMKPADQGAGKDAAAPPALAPRPDGKPHFPAIPDGHYRILASDSSVHDIPTHQIEHARQIDPLLHVLNP